MEDVVHTAGWPAPRCFSLINTNMHCMQTQTEGPGFPPMSHTLRPEEQHHHQITPRLLLKQTRRSFLIVSSSPDCAVCEAETPTYLPHPGHSYFRADNGGPLVFVSPKTPSTASVFRHIYSPWTSGGDAGCGAAERGGRLHKYWRVPLFVSSPWVFFSPPHGAAGTRTDAALRLAGADAGSRPRVRHVTAADFLLSSLLHVFPLKISQILFFQSVK